MTESAAPRRRVRAWLRWLLAPLLGAALAAVAAGPALAAPAAPLELQDDTGAVRRLAQPPQRIVSLLPSLTESLHALGAGARLVGVDRWSNWPPEVQRLPRLGGMDDALVEAIVALRPDLVLASTATRAMQRLQALGVPVLQMKSDTHDDVQRSLLLLARLLGQPQAGVEAWARIQAELQAAADRVPPALHGQRVYFEIGGGPHVAGRASFIGQTLAVLGLGNVADASMGPFPRLNPEFVLRARPDIVIAAQRDLQTMAARPGWGGLPALHNGRHCGLPPDDYERMVRPGPRMGQAAAVLADCLQRMGSTR